MVLSWGRHSGGVAGRHDGEEALRHLGAMDTAKHATVTGEPPQQGTAAPKT